MNIINKLKEVLNEKDKEFKKILNEKDVEINNIKARLINIENSLQNIKEECLSNSIWSCQEACNDSNWKYIWRRKD